jgi:hypothetical protein
MAARRIDHAHRGATGLALPDEVEQVDNDIRPLAWRVQVLVTGCKAGKEGADKKLRLLEALGGQILFADFFGYCCCERDIFGRADRIHGFYCSVEANGGTKSLRRIRFATARFHRTARLRAMPVRMENHRSNALEPRCNAIKKRLVHQHPDTLASMRPAFDGHASVIRCHAAARRRGDRRNGAHRSRCCKCKKPSGQVAAEAGHIMNCRV